MIWEGGGGKMKIKFTLSMHVADLNSISHP